MLYTTISTVGCHSRASFRLAPVVNATTREVRERLQAGARYCAGGVAGPDLASVVGTPGFEGPGFTVAAAGNYTATYQWVFTYNASLNASGAVDTGTPTSSATALVSIYALGYLYDTTNSTVLDGDGGAAFPLFREIHEGSWWGGARHVEVNLTNTFTLVTGHVYDFETVLMTVAEAFAYASGRAWAILNLGSVGDHARLVGLELTSG